MAFNSLNNVDPEVSELLTAAEGIGDPDPGEAGHHAESVIDHVTEHPPASTTQPPPPIDAHAGEPRDEPTDPAIPLLAPLLQTVITGLFSFFSSFIFVLILSSGIFLEPVI